MMRSQIRIVTCARCGTRFGLLPHEKGTLCEVCEGDDSRTETQRLELIQLRMKVARKLSRAKAACRANLKTIDRQVDYYGRNVRSVGDVHFIDQLHRLVLAQQLDRYRLQELSKWSNPQDLNEEEVDNLNEDIGFLMESKLQLRSKVEIKR